MIRLLHRRFWLVAVLALLPAEAWAKERHFEQLRVVLISRSARCVTCHTSADGAGLNAYGQRLHALPADDALADRIAALEADPPAGASEAERAEKARDRDIDGDGVPNWVEILAGADPASAEHRPKPKRAERITRVVSCKLCHTANHLPGKDGVAANPHNAFGELLATTFDLPRRRRRPKTDAAVRAAAERTPILRRLVKIRKKRPRKSRATYWQKIRLLRAPADPDDNPTSKALKRFKKKAAHQRSKRKRDPTRGLDCPAHRADGFLRDADGLD